MDLTGKTVFLTGGAMGIGRGVMEALLERGAKVLFCDVSKAAGEATRDELLQTFSPTDIFFVHCDVSEGAQLTEAFQKAVEELKAVDICINNAAIMDERIWEKMIAVNQTAVIRGSYLALEHMRKDRGGKGGVILNTASTAGLALGQSLFPVYQATKRAIVGFTTSWANSPDQPAHGVRWGVVCPGAAVTPLHDNIQGRLFRAPVAVGRDGTPLPDQKKSDKSKWLKPAEVARAFLALLDDDDSNGDVITVSRDQDEDDPPLKLTVLAMDRSAVPVTSLVEKTVITVPACGSRISDSRD